jgi:hypothetical protein
LTEAGVANPTGAEILEMTNQMEQECMAAMMVIYGTDE